MAKKLRVGDTVRGYRVTKIFGPGMMAISYGAEGPSGERVFLKQYKSPTPAVVWYRAFVDYQHELANRIRSGKAAHYAVCLLESFEERWGGPTYFAAYEFVENGRDLEHMLAEESAIHRRTGAAPSRDPATWARHVTWAKVLNAGIAALHEAKIVHADLKPANAYLIEDAGIGAGYQLKLIDTDFSVLADRRAPWHGHQGYVGTDNYRSPEHMRRGAVPILASDVFTGGIMLWELLAGVHPYWQEDQAEYAKRVHAYDVKPPGLLGVMPAPANNAAVSMVLYRCLDPDPARRPSAAEVRAVLSGRGAAAPARTAAGPRTTAPLGPKPGGGAGLKSERIELVAAGGVALRIGVRTEIGKAILRRFGPEAEFWDTMQCTVERRNDGQWIVTPAPRTVNETLVNGAPLTAARALIEGDVIAAGRSAKGISKLPLTAHAA
ncbi:MAG: protein kinase [Candidatus Binatia bacterium]